MTEALWIAALVVFVVTTLSLKLAVRLCAKGADNGWDNALGYVLLTTLLTVALRFVAGTGSWLLIGLSPLLAFVVQTVALKVIYEITALRAWVLGMVHLVFTTFVVGGITMAVGAIVAYVWYGRIIADPLLIIRALLKWLGIELPFPI